jgi:uncharacterized membrane protein YfcA
VRGASRREHVLRKAEAVLTYALLFLAAALGGALNSVAGGGSFISFPALLFAGVAPIPANATNTVALWPAGVASAFAYRREMRHERRAIAALSIASLVGSVAGALLLLRTRETTFVVLLPFLLLFATLVFTFAPKLQSRFLRRGDSQSQLRIPLGVAFAVQIVIAVYGGYFGGGMGILMLAILSLMGMTDIHAMNGFKVVLGVVINGAAVVLFVFAGAVVWGDGAVMIAGGTLGGFVGAYVARKIEPRIVKRFVLVVAWGMTAYFFARTFVFRGV